MGRIHPDAGHRPRAHVRTLLQPIWEWVAVAIATATIVSWVYYTSNIQTLPAEYGYVGVILITAFTYTLLRLRFVLVLLVTLGSAIGAYLPYAFTTQYVAPVERSAGDALSRLIRVPGRPGCASDGAVHANAVPAGASSWIEERLQESDGLLLNILPQVVVDQLKVTPGRRIGQAFEQVTVVFVDAVGVRTRPLARRG